MKHLDRSLVRALGWNAAAKWTSQVLSWLSTIIVARLLTPSDYGIMGMAGVYLTFATLVSQTGIGEVVITLRDLTEQQIAELNTVALLVGIGQVGISCAVASPLAWFFSTPQLRAVVIVASVTYIITAFQIVPSALLRRELRFKVLSSIEAARVFCQITTVIILAWYKFGYWSLLLGHVVGCTVASALILVCKRHSFAMPRYQGLKRELKFAKDVLLSAIAWFVYDNADFGVAGRVLGQAPLGNYSVAWTIASAPVEKISTLITGVTPAFFSAVQTNQAELRRYLLRLTEILSYVTIPASIGLALTADSVVPVLLGHKWLGCVGALRLLALFVTVRSLATILPNLLTSIGDARFVMRATILSAIVMPIAFVIGSRWGTSGIAAAWLIGYPPVISPMYYRALTKTDTTLKQYFSVVFPALSATALMTAVVLLVRTLAPSSVYTVIGLVSIVIIGALTYAVSLLIFFRDRVSKLLQTFKRMRQESPEHEESVDASMPSTSRM